MDPVSSVGAAAGERSDAPALMTERAPHRFSRAARALAGSAARSAALLGGGEVRQPRERVGHVLHFADGSRGRVYRETQVRPDAVEAPATLVVRFRLRAVRGRGHALFRAESLLNTPLFLGFPGFRSKLWLAHDDNEVYRGVYSWDGPHAAEAYVRSLWWALALVSDRSSIGWVVVPGLHRDHVLREPGLLSDLVPGGGEWWRLVGYDDDPTM